MLKIISTIEKKRSLRPLKSAFKRNNKKNKKKEMFLNKKNI